MTKPISNAQNVSDANHELLLNLQTQLARYAETQGEENKRIHERIDETQDRTARAIDGLKDLLNARGRVSSGFIFSLVAVIISSLALIGGFGSSYVSMKIEALKPDIAAHDATIRTLAERVSAMDREAAHEQGRRESDSVWLRRELDKITTPAK